MAIEVYKHEVGTTLSVHLTQWAFYWEVSNTSGRDQRQVSWDIALSLEGFLGWFSQFREFWPAGNRCHLYRIRRVWPTIEPWNDYYWYFRDYGGRFVADAALKCVKARVQWWTTSGMISNACTYINQWPDDAFRHDSLWGQNLGALEAWADLHDAVHTTAFGDQYRPCILTKLGNYETVMGHWVDPRPVPSRAYRWKG